MRSNRKLTRHWTDGKEDGVVRIKVGGINTTKKRLASGEIRVYRYHRGTKTALPGEPGSPEFLRAYAEAEALRPKRAATLANELAEYLRSAHFAKKAPSTQREYSRLCGKLESAFGDMPLRALDSPKAAGVFLDWHEEQGLDTPREADNAMQLLSMILKRAKRRGRIRVNPLSEGFERQHHGDRSDVIWTEADVTRFMDGAPVELQRAMILFMHTGQRYGDVIRMRWADYDGEVIRLTQRKTGEPVEIPCTRALRQMLEAMPRSGPYILTRADGRPWFTDGNDKALSKAWAAHMKVAGLWRADPAERLQLRDLRGTTVTLLFEAEGCEIGHICAITGHTLKSAHSILERYRKRTKAAAVAAMRAFEASPSAAFANRLQTTPVADRAAITKPKGTQDVGWYRLPGSNGRPPDPQSGALTN